MKEIEDFLKNRVGEVILILALVVISIYSGVGLGILLSLVLVFLLLAIAAHMSKIGKSVYLILQTVVVLLIIGSIVGAFFPRSSAKKEIAMAYIDQGVAELMGDKTKLLAKDIFNINKDEKGKKFLAYYNSLLSNGKVQEAQDTLNGWMRAWSFDQKEENNFQSQPQPQPQAQTQTQPDSESSSPVILSLGSNYYTLKAGESTPWLRFPEGCVNYEIISEHYLYNVLFSDNTFYPGGPNTQIPRKNDVSLKIISRGNEIVTIKIS